MTCRRCVCRGSWNGWKGWRSEELGSADLDEQWQETIAQNGGRTLMTHPIDDADIAWLGEYEAVTLAYFRPRFHGYEARFAGGNALMNRFSLAIREVVAQGRNQFSAVDEAHNEMCVADAVLSDSTTREATLLYEPPLPNTKKTIDFVLREANGRVTLIDVKTIKPQSRDRWDQYVRAIKENWLPSNVQFILQQGWQGGELWHIAFASRSRFLEYALEFEEKLASASYDDARHQILMLCGEGFYWHQDELEDFIEYYRTGVHREDDPFALAEARHIQENKLALLRSISSFGCLDRRQGDIRARRINWHIERRSNEI